MHQTEQEVVHFGANPPFQANSKALTNSYEGIRPNGFPRQMVNWEIFFFEEAQLFNVGGAYCRRKTSSDQTEKQLKLSSSELLTIALTHLKCTW